LNYLFYGAFCFYATLAVYNFQRLFKSKGKVNTSPWLNWVNENRKYLTVLIVLSVFVNFILFFRLVEDYTPTVILFLICGCICVLYVYPFKWRALREIPFIKSYVIGIIWVALIALFPILNEGIEIGPLILELVGLFSLIFALVIPFDIRDLKYDNPNLKTIPILLGISWSKFIGVVLIIGFGIIFLSEIPQLRESKLFYVSLFLAILMIVKTTEKRSESYFAIIDGLMILIGISFLCD